MLYVILLYDINQNEVLFSKYGHFTAESRKIKDFILNNPLKSN